MTYSTFRCAPPAARRAQRAACPAAPGLRARHLQPLSASPPGRRRSDYPLESLPPSGIIPRASSVEEFKLNAWQQRHALLLLDTVHQLHDLRFVLCPRCGPGLAPPPRPRAAGAGAARSWRLCRAGPVTTHRSPRCRALTHPTRPCPALRPAPGRRRMSEARFWVIYLTMVRRLLPPEAFADAAAHLPRTSSAGSSAAAAASSAASAVAAAANSALSSLGISRSNSKVSTPVKRAGSGTTADAPFGGQQQQAQQAQQAQQQQQQAQQQQQQQSGSAAAGSGARAAELRGREGSGTTEHTSEVLVEMPGASAEEEDPDGLDLENDPELEAYLQEALQVGAGAGGGRRTGSGGAGLLLAAGATRRPQTMWRLLRLGALLTGGPATPCTRCRRRSRRARRRALMWATWTSTSTSWTRSWGPTTTTTRSWTTTTRC
jgi:hypothetical protein